MRQYGRGGHCQKSWSRLTRRRGPHNDCIEKQYCKRQSELKISPEIIAGANADGDGDGSPRLGTAVVDLEDEGASSWPDEAIDRFRSKKKSTNR